ncbi:MAG: hypothetical protein JNJ59_12220 [Deltaproteobacteria bacterium]|nr:hypothetical protein [Deltaproteobacteria bacterium]
MSEWPTPKPSEPVRSAVVSGPVSLEARIAMNTDSPSATADIDLATAPVADAPEGTAAAVLSWAEGRLRLTLPKVVGRCMSFSAAHCFDDALLAAVQRFYGVEVDVATAETDILEDDFERVRFFPWFLWDFELPSDGRSIGERFREEAELDDFEQSLVDALLMSSVTFVEVLGVRPADQALDARDLHGDELLELRDPGLSKDLAPGQLALVRLVREPSSRALAQAGGPPAMALVDAIYAVLPCDARALVEDEMTRLITGEREPLRVLKARGPELLDFAEHVLTVLTATPTLINGEGEPIVLCRKVVTGQAAQALGAMLQGVTGPGVGEGPLAGFSIDPVHPRSFRLVEDDRLIGWIRPRDERFRGTETSAWFLETSARERLERLEKVLVKAGADLPALHVEEDLACAASNWLARGETDRWLEDPDVASAFRRGLGEWLAGWADTPHPSLGKRSPREALADPEGEAVVGRLLQRVKQVAGDDAVTRIDLRLS